MKQHIIGVFDSGIGGISVVNAIKKALPTDEIVYINDSANLPYGTKSPDQLLKLVTPKLTWLQDQGCQVIVIACNTVTTSLIDRLRQEFLMPLVGMEPMVKPAAELTKSGIIAICATPVTLASPRYAYLKKKYASDIIVLEPDCSNWAQMIESSKVDKKQISERIETTCQANADVIVLGCTHYHWIEDMIKLKADGRARVLQPEVPVIIQLKQVLEHLP